MPAVERDGDDQHVVPAVPDTAVEDAERATLEFKQFQGGRLESKARQIKRDREEEKNKRIREGFDTFKWVISILLAVFLTAVSIAMIQLSGFHDRIDSINRQRRETRTRLAVVETRFDHEAGTSAEAMPKERGQQEEENAE